MSRTYYYKTLMRKNDGKLCYFVQKNYNLDDAWHHAQQVLRSFPELQEVEEVSRMETSLAKEIIERDDLFIDL